MVCLENGSNTMMKHLATLLILFEVLVTVGCYGHEEDWPLQALLRRVIQILISNDNGWSSRRTINRVTHSVYRRDGS